MIVALGFGNTNGDTPSVFVVDTDKCTKEWREAILRDINIGNYEFPKEWGSLEKARVKLPALVEAAVFVYYD